MEKQIGFVNRLKERINYLQAMLDQSPDLIIAGDKDGRIVEFNRGAEKMLGYRKEEVLRRPIKELYAHPSERDRLMELMQRYGSVMDYEIRIRTKRGKVLPMSTTLAYLKDSKGNVVGTIGIAKDIRRRKFLEKKLVKMSVTDGLTGLYDRGYFDKRITDAVRDAVKMHQPLALIMMDLDGFKKYNDTKGHLEGDKILNKVGRIILRTIRRRVDSCYRYGGDEFVVILPEKHHALARDIADEIRVEIELAFGPAITATVGVAKLKAGQSVYDFIKAADLAMYKAKAAGGNKVCIEN
jgi:diguanylate cyclase (GGDEF)-like protein/PAS domain S-box-containing protein